MTSLKHSKTMESRRPALTVAHKVRIGKSVQAHCSRRRLQVARDMLALKFMHVPDDTDFENEGLLTHSHNRMMVELPTKLNTQTHLFSGSRRRLNNKSFTSDFILVFVNGTFWLERVADFANCLRHDGLRNGSMEVLGLDDTKMIENDLVNNPDSWMSEASVCESVSPRISGEVDEHITGTALTKSTKPPISEKVAAPSRPLPSLATNTPPARSHPSAATQSKSCRGQTVRHIVHSQKARLRSRQASKSIAGWTVSVKPLPGVSRSATAASFVISTGKQSGFNDAMHKKKAEPGTKKGLKGDVDDSHSDQSSASSSSDSSSDESSSDSDLDSDGTTDSSSSDED